MRTKTPKIKFYGRFMIFSIFLTLAAENWINRFLNVISTQNWCCFSEIYWNFSKEYDSGVRISPYLVPNLGIGSSLRIAYNFKFFFFIRTDVLWCQIHGKIEKNVCIWVFGVEKALNHENWGQLEYTYMYIWRSNF